MQQIALPARASHERDFDFGDLPMTLWRRKWIILAVLLLGLLGARVLIGRLTPVYTATTQVMIAPGPPVLDLQEVAAVLRGDSEATDSEVYVLRSRDLALRVADALDLHADPEFNPLLRAPQVPWWRRAVDYWPLRGPRQADAEAVPALTADQQRNLVSGTLLAHIEAVPVGGSRVMAITAHSASPDKAAQIANTVAEEYLAAQIASKRDATVSANTWLIARARELEAEVHEREAAVEAYRARAGLTHGTGAMRLSDEEASGLSTQLVLARAEHAAARARLAEVEKLIQASGNAAVGDVLDAPLVRTLREQQAQLHREIAELSEEYGPLHPRLVHAQAQLRDTDQAIRAEVAKLVHGLRNEAAVARAREAALAGTLESLKARTGRQNASEVGLRALEREAESSRALLETFLARAKETSAQSTHAVPDARIISRAVSPLGPSFPNTRLLLMIAGAFALAAGILLALLREGMDRVVRTRAGIERLLGIETLAVLPLLHSRPWRRRPPEWVLRAPRSEYSEALRGVYTGLVVANMHAPPRVILFTSPLPNEGKTSTLLALGRLLAGTGQRVVAMDLNLRKPTLHKAARLGPNSGLGEWFENGGDGFECLHRDPLSPLWLVPAGRVRTDRSVLLRSDRFARLMEHLRASFDVVLLDSPPVLAVADAQILTCLADTTVLLVRAGTTSRDASAEAFALLTRARGVPPRVVLNAARRREELPRHGHGLAAYYDDIPDAPPPPRRMAILPAPLERAEPG